jgi:hypothetical protein
MLALRAALPPAAVTARIVLPRAIYVLAAAGLFAAHAATAGGGCRAGDRSRLALFSLTPPLLLLSGGRAPLLALLSAAQACALVGCHAPPAGVGGSSAADGWRLVSLGAALHVTVLQLFFATGHASSFDALHFAASFTGFDSFHFGRQGFLLAANTWAAELAAAAALPAIAAAAAARGAGGERRSLALLALTRAALRAAGVAAAAVAAAALRRHLHVWSHFAPHFVFEAAGALLVDFLLIITAASG